MAQEPDPRPRLIGLHGRKQSGKDTCGDRLVVAHGYARVAFADPLRLFLTELDPLVGVRDGRLVRLATVLAEAGGDWGLLKDEARDPVHREIRTLLQKVGNEAGKAVFGETVWADRGLETARRLGGPVVFTDVRFDVEAQAITAAGSAVLAGILLKLGTYGFVRIAMPILPDAWQRWAMVAVVVGVISVLWGAFVALAQTDVKTKFRLR